MKRAFHDVHDHKHTEGCTNESEEGQVHLNEVAAGNGGHQDLIVEDLGELGVGKGESPETQVGGGVGDSSEDELDGLDHLMDEDLDCVVGALWLEAKTLNQILLDLKTIFRGGNSLLWIDAVSVLEVIVTGGIASSSHVLHLGLVDLVVILVSGDEVDWLDTEHEGNANHDDSKQDLHDLGLFLLWLNQRLPSWNGWLAHAHSHINGQSDD